MSSETITKSEALARDIPSSKQRLALILLRHWTLLALALVLATFAFTADSFYTRGNWIAVSVYASGLIAVSLGQTFAIITGGIDLSVGGNMALSGMAAGLMMRAMVNYGLSEGSAIALGIAVGLAVGALVGLINGLVVTKAGLTPFIVTLGMLGITTGMTRVISGGRDLYEIPRAFPNWGSDLIGGWLSPLVAVSLVAALLCGVLLSKTRFGLRSYAIGSNPEAARKVGLGVDRHLIKVYLLCGVLAGLCGILVVSRFGSALTTTGTGAELQSIAAVVIGGASLFGGSGSILGTMTGVAIMSSLVTGLILSGVQPFWQTVVTGIVIIAAVYIDKLRDRVALEAER